MGKSKTCAYGIAMPGLVCAILFMYASFLGAFLPGLLKPANDAKTPIIGNPKMHVPLISGVFLLVVINFSLWWQVDFTRALYISYKSSARLMEFCEEVHHVC